ncbi:MAG TPA: peptidase S58 [Clostridiales bacterium]|nr:peptidase S58 [Clostridiales bacterium]
MNRTITAVPGIRAGHFTDAHGLTGCTVVLAAGGATAGVDVRGSAPGTRETDLLRPVNLVEKAHAVLITGGSAFGLAAADGVMAYLEAQGEGFPTGVARVPIVAAAVLFDLAIGDPAARPRPEDGFAACTAADDGPVAEGNVGAGTGCTVGKVLGMARAMRGGLACSACETATGLKVGVLAAVNCFGEVVCPDTGRILAGPRDPATGRPVATTPHLGGPLDSAIRTNTTLAVVATDGALSKEEANKVAQMAHDGLARVIRPCHTMYDGDAIFALATGRVRADVNLVGALAADMVAAAVVRAIRIATAWENVAAWQDSERGRW